MTILVAAFVLGGMTGLRAMTPLAVFCWFAYLQRIAMDGTWGGWTAHGIVVGVFTLFALGEYVGDTLPRTPNRTTAVPLIVRIAMGGLAGALLMAGLAQPLGMGIAAGALGGLAGTYGGFYARGAGTRLIGRDLPVALVEDLVAIGGSIGAMMIAVK